MLKETMFNDAKNFFQVFEPKGETIASLAVPGSVEVLGDVTEFNKGKAISANLNKSALIMVQKRKERDRSIHFYSRRYDEKIRMSLNDQQFREEHGWANYVSSTLFMLEGTGKKVGGLNVYIDDNIPDFFNANSMEALEIGIASIAQKFGDWTITGAEIADICSDAELKFMKKPKNTAKYMPAIFGKKGMLNYCDAGKSVNENMNFDIDGLVFMVMSAGLKKKTMESRIMKIIDEVKESISIIKGTGKNIDSLDAMTMEEFDEFRSRLSITQRKRCAYFISENDRVEAGKQALASGDTAKFLEIINESQKNIANRLEVVTEENEALMDISLENEGVKAARLLNMGIDGTVLLVLEKGKRIQVETKIKKSFLARTGLEINSEVFDLTNEIEETNINVSEFKNETQG